MRIECEGASCFDCAEGDTEEGGAVADDAERGRE